MMIQGPYIEKTVQVEVTCQCGHTHFHDRQEFDYDAYWNLDYMTGQPWSMEEPMLLYAKVAYPTLATAQTQWRIEREAIDARRGSARRPRRKKTNV